MQVSNTLNNVIRILFNPTVETFKLFDFLVVKSDEDRYIAEIIEIYDDKFDASQNVAKLKIFYKINENNEVMPYDNFTPNKECEIVKIKQDEIEKFINQDKDTFVFGTNVKNSCDLNVQYNFFDNNAVVLADKIENSNGISLNLAQKLSEKKHVVIIDSTGIIELDEAKKVKASKNFKLPLNYTTIDFIFDKCLYDSSLEFQATGIQIISEIKKFAKKQEMGFIPFNAFTKVLTEQYKVTPYPELKLLLERIKRYQMEDIFTNSKKDYESLFKTIKSSPITIIDLSGIESAWQKAYIEYFVEDIQEDIYLITRINDENCDVDLINKIYCQKKNITFVPTVSYNYKKLPTIVQYCKNYVLLPSLYQRSDFLNANFALSNLISDQCIIFGEDTDNFLYLAKDYEFVAKEEERKNYRKIALSLIEDEEENLEQNGDYFENIKKEAAKKTDSERLMEELTKFEKEKEQAISSDVDEVEEKSQEEKDNISKFLEDDAEEDDSEIVEEVEAQDEFQEIDNKIELSEEEESITDVELDKDSVTLEEMEETSELEIKKPERIQEEPKTEEKESKEEIKEFVPKSDPEIGKVDIVKADLVDPETIDLEELAKDGKTDYEKAQEAENSDDEPEEEVTEEAENTDDTTLGDDELDFFELAENPKENEDIDLEEIADNSMSENFEEIVNSKPKEGSQTVAIDKDINISTDILEKPAKNSSLPIFKEENNNDEMPEFKEGDVVVHPKYGRGTIIKTLKHEQRQLIHVDFEQADKKLLDPKVANIKLEQ